MSWVPGLRQVNAVYQTVQNAHREEHNHLFRLKKDLEALKGHLKDDPMTVLGKAHIALESLKAILDCTNQEQRAIFQNPRNLGGILAPLRNLAGSLQAYVFPTLSHPQPPIQTIEDHLPEAEQALNGQIEAQQGILARLMTAGVDLFKREWEYTTQRLAGNGRTGATFISRHPLLELRHLIATFRENGHHYLPQDREEHLRHSLEYLTYYGEFFGPTDAHQGVERFVLNRMGDTRLSDNLPALIDAIHAFVIQEIRWLTPEANERFYLLLYHVASGRDDVYTPIREDREGQVAWSVEYLGRNADTWNRDVLWEAASQYDDITQMQTLYEKIDQTRECHTPLDLADNLDRTLRFFEHMPQGQIRVATLTNLSTILVSWMSFARHWVEANASSGKAGSLEQIQKAHHALNQGKHIEAIRLLKQEIENGPIATALSADRVNVSPLRSFQEVRQEMEDVAQVSKQTASTNWEAELGDACLNLSETLSFYVTFQVAFEHLFKVSPSNSQQIYNQIILEVEENPEKKTRQFFHALSREIDRSEVSFFYKIAAKLIMLPVYMMARLLGDHITASGLHFVKHYIQLPSREPLGKIHVTPIEKLTRCFQANIGAMKAWAEDRTCFKWGATIRKEGLAKILKRPELNDNFEREELVMKSGLLATDLFFNICQFQEIPRKLLRNVALNIERPFFPLPAEHWANFIAKIFKSILALSPQLVVQISFYLLKMLDYMINIFLKWGVKKALVAYDSPNHLFKSLSHSLYHSQYIPVFDGMILQQLQKIERAIDDERSGAQLAENESDTTREIFKEMIENLFEMIEMRHNLTKEKMLNPRKDDLAFLGEHTREVIRGLVDDNLSETLVNILITLIQSLFNEDQMNDFLLSLIRAITASFASRESLLTEEEKARIRQIRGTALSERIVQEEVKKKLYQQEREIHDSLQRIIQKSVHQVVQITSDQLTGQKPSLEYLDWMQRCFYGGESGNFLISMRRKLEAFRQDDANKQQIIETLQEDFLTFMRELEEKQKALDLEPVSHTRRLQKFANSVVLPHLQHFSRSLRNLAYRKSLAACVDCEEALGEFNRALLIKKTRFRSIQGVELERKQLEGEGFIGKLRVAKQAALEALTPPIASQVEEALCRKLNTLASGVIRLPKDSTFSESLMCHLALLPFMESNGRTPDLRFTEGSPIIQSHG